MLIDLAVIAAYLLGMVALGWWGMRRTRNKSDYLVAGRRLGPLMYAGTMAAVVLGVASICVALAVDNVVAALTLAYNILVGGLLVAILGGLVWRRGTRAGALASMLAGSAAVIVTMALTGLLANEPVYAGLGTALAVYVVVSLMTEPTAPAVLDRWQRRLRGQDAPECQAPGRAATEAASSATEATDPAQAGTERTDRTDKHRRQEQTR